MHRLLASLFLATVPLHAATQITWERTQMHGDFYSEGAAIGDINGDGKPDVIAGPFWWEGPAFEKKHAFYEPKIFDINGYSDNFFAYVCDFNGDKKNDILVLGFPGKEARLYLNPGVPDDKPWPMSIVADVVDNESPVFTDITGDGKPEIVCSTGGKFGWFAPNWDKPTEKWPFVAISEDMKVAKFTHGLGVGDVNGDGKFDLLEARRWWEQPDEPKGNVPYQRKLWTQHNFAAGVGGGAQMFAYDFDGNGTNDVFTSLAAHRYGVAVYLQSKVVQSSGLPDAAGTAAPHWKQVMLASENPADNDYGIVFSQPHAAALADINGDGVMDIVVGKRYWAHNGHDPDERGARVVYWYETKRDGNGGVDFIPHLVDANSGVGTDVTIGDVNGDGLPDIVAANKGGVFILTQKRSDTTAEVKPVKMYGPGLKPQTDYAHGQSPQDALKNLQLPTGFKAELIAAEPDIVQPIAFSFDERGRIWVLEGLSYPQPRKEGEGQDRIVILEDSNGDGTYETKKVFCEGINLGSGIEVGFGGVWVGAAPYLMFIPRDGDKPATEANPQFTNVPGLKFTAYALLDGFGTQDTHETLNSFIWGPDGWLYGCHGVFTHSKIGKPGTPDDQRTPMNAGVWRYHPVRHVFEVFAQGTSNPWGLDYDQNGEWFVTACVIPHLYHIVPGARYHRQGGQHFNPYTYEDIVTIADHAHYAGDIRNNAHWGGRDGGSLVQDDTNSAGGGHAHCGLAIYQSSQFPATYRNKLIFGNLHGHRLVTDYLDPHGSTYIGKHGSDFMRSNDLNFIPVTQKVGPDGSLYVSDWSDKQVCHRGSGAVELWDRSNGRIYRVSYAGGEANNQAISGGGSQPILIFPKAPFDLAEESDEMLARLAVQTENEWFARQARRVLQQRAASDKAGKGLQAVLDALYANSNNKAGKLRAMWLAHSLRTSWFSGNASTDPFSGLKMPAGNIVSETVLPDDEVLRAWNVRLRGDQSHSGVYAFSGVIIMDAAHNGFGTWNSDGIGEARLAAQEKSPVVRRELAALLQNHALSSYSGADGNTVRPGYDLARALLAHGEDKDDPYIPLLIWYGIEPLVGADPKVGLELAKVSKLPKVTEFIYRRMGAEEAGRGLLLEIATTMPDGPERQSLIASIVTSARADRKMTLPANWKTLSEKLLDAKSPRSEFFDIWELEAIAGLEDPVKTFEHIAYYASNEDVANKARALQVLLATGHPRANLTMPLTMLVSDEYPQSLRRQIIQGLALFPRAREAEKAESLSIDTALMMVIEKHRSPEEIQDAVNTLATWNEGAKTLLTAVKEKKIPSTMLSPFLARQLAALNDADVSALLKDTFGDLNAPKANLDEQKKKFRALLTKGDLAAADKAKGKVLFAAICGQCHTMFGEGQKVGPDLTGSNRANLDYLLDNVLDPNAVIGKDYQLNLFELKDGRVASGVVKEESTAAFRIAMPGGAEQTIAASEVKKRTIAKVSTMPEGLFDALPVEQLRQLVAYLQTNASPAKGGGAPARQVEGAIEGETLKVLSKTGGGTKVQGMGSFGSKWSGGSQLWWTGAKPGQTLTLALPVAKAGKYALKGVLTKARDYGIVTVALDGKAVLSDWDGFNMPAVELSEELDWGTHDLTAGDHQLTFTIKGANAQAVKGYMVGLDYARLEAR